ncbi:nitronate monooxygenase [Bradyrhizobium sp. CSA207]|uniref:NAD(P)H-dependent flavin oxidoreductase n=1 Tax=Bradyrhizobium sp. CSA207 TaxID=2698826 RepID=UPI0023AFFF52|nr:nitronate monooxygenase [Bradyrhizobium sp. CSA207]MDE5444866.1 nitronate monooxygenase [Bradyrhizobium sp. CSA207]
MSLDPKLRRSLSLPTVCAPMFLVSGPDLVREACKAGVIGALPRQNARSFDEFADWLRTISADLREHAGHAPGPVGPLAVNLSAKTPEDQVGSHLDLCAEQSVDIVITVGGNPKTIVQQAHDRGIKVFHDITSIPFAERAIAAGVDGLICIGAGGGGHSGTISHLALIRKVRSIFNGTIVMAGAISDGATIRAAEVLGADLAYLGTRFIATTESLAPDEYKRMIVSQTSSDLIYTEKVAGVAANWLAASLRAAGLNPDALPEPKGKGMRHDHLPESAKPWKNLWSAGQGIDLIDEIPSVADLVGRLKREYAEACQTPAMV